MPDTLTAAQAAFVLDEPLATFRKAVERSPVKARLVLRGGVRVRQFRLGDIVFLRAERELRNDLTPKGRADLYRALATLPPADAKREVAFGDFRFNYGRHLTAILAKLDELKQFTSEISGEDATIGTTGIEAHRIAALLDGGMTVEAILADYPSLGERQVLAAEAYAAAHPKPGRPFPKNTAKAAMRDVDLDDLDAFIGARE